jgi:outer membrane receptor protein involved in Fe transport
VEFEGQAKPFPGLVLGANLAYDETRIDTISANSTAGAEIGDPLPNVPKWSGALTADYSFPVVGATGTVGVTYHYQGSAASSFSGLNSDIDTKIPAYSVVGLRARLDWRRYSAVFRIDNLANTYAFTNIELVQLVPGDPGDPVFGSGVPIQPRTYRVSLEARF